MHHIQNAESLGTERLSKLIIRFSVPCVLSLLVSSLYNIVDQMFIGNSVIPGHTAEEYWEFAERAFRILLSLMVCTCVIKMAAIFFQAVGHPVLAIIASSMRDIAGFVPLALLLSLPLGIDGILYAMPLSDFIAAAVTAVLLIWYFGKLKKNG